MKTTLIIHDTVMDEIRQEAARTGKTISELVEGALRRFLIETKRAAERKLPPLPTFDSGGALVDINDREALYRVMGGRW